MTKADTLIQNRYRIVRLLGSGGFGAVYLAEDLRLGRAVAIKEVDAARLGPDERAVAEQLFEREARVLASLDHPGLTRIWDYFEQNDRAFLVMEYVPGHTLRDLLHRGGPLDEGFVLECAIQICAVLAYLHARQPPVIFRDLKPANIMAVEPPPDPDPYAPPEAPAFRLIDFGIARLFKPEQTGDTLVIGTPGYAPPEQYGHGQTDQRSDIYSLGATLFHLLSGQVPSSVPPPPLASVHPAISNDLARVVARATEPEPADRYQSAEEMRRDLLAIDRARRAGGGGAQVVARPPAAAGPRVTVSLPPHTRTPAPPRQSSSAQLIVLVLAMLGIVALGVLGLGALGRPAGSSQAGRPTPAPQPTAPPAAREWLLSDAPGRIAFGQRDQGGFDVWIATLDGAAPRRVTSDLGSYSPAWSPDGARLSVTHDSGGAPSAYVGDQANPLAEQISPPDLRARYPAWSPDGARLAMATSRDGGRSWQLAIVDLASRAITFPQAPSSVGGVAWAPGRLLAFAARPAPGQPQDLFVLDETGAARNVTDTPDLEEDLPAWSPDGRRLAFVSSQAGAANLPQRQIFTIGADGSGRAQLTSGPGPHSNPTWSPDGKWIAYVAQETSPDWQVWAMRADGSAPRPLTFGPQRKFYLAWGR